MKYRIPIRLRPQLKKFNRRIKISKDYKKEIFRKSIHLSSLWIPAAIYFVPAYYSLVLFGILFCADFLLEYGNYKKWNWARKIFGTFFTKTLRNTETKHTSFRLCGSSYVFLAAIFCIALFSKPIAIIAMMVMLISDTAAALIGKAFGTRKIYKNKSLEGTVAFFMSALIINMLFEPMLHFTYISVIACFAATCAEIFENKIKIDDNLSIPLVTGIILTISEYL